jgi:ABC-type glycerol-3-phosphate transport system substrate-binding protein
VAQAPQAACRTRPWHDVGGSRGRARRHPGRALAAVGAVLAGTQLLAACGDTGATAGGRVTLNFYNFPDNSGAIQQAVDTCSRNSGGRYVIRYNRLPNGADGQRQQLVRRLAAHDTAMDILGLDVTWEAEFAEAGWIRDWTGANRAKATAGTLAVPLETATWRGRLVAVPYNSNTQLLWYRSDLVPTPPRTWTEMIDMAEALARQGKPHRIEVQGAQYEGTVVWFNTMIASAGGQILDPGATRPSLGQPAIEALTLMRRLARSPAADPSLSVQMEDDNRLAMESGTAAFELNYPFVYPSMRTNQPALSKHFRWALYPRVKPDEPSHVTVGGIDLAISTYSPHPDLAFEAALCLRNRENQKLAAVKGGLPPSLADLYDDPSLQAEYPFRAEIKTALSTASVRPKTPAYQNLSIVIAHAVSPPDGIDPPATLQELAGQLTDALASKGLVP